MSPLWLPAETSTYDYTLSNSDQVVFSVHVFGQDIHAYDMTFIRNF